MPGSWEASPPHVLTAILHVETTTIAWAFGLMNLVKPGPVLGLSGLPFDHARNAACMRALEVGASHLFFLDSDVIPPREAILTLLSHDLPIVSGVYCRRSPPHGIPVMMKGGQWVTRLPNPNGPNRLFEVDVVGAGCLLIRRDVLEKMPPQRVGCHWFDWRVHLKGSEGFEEGECMSEDFTWCAHARRCGWPVIVDSAVRCRHVGNAQADYGSLLPLEHHPQT